MDKRPALNVKHSLIYLAIAFWLFLFFPPPISKRKVFVRVIFLKSIFISFSNSFHSFCFIENHGINTTRILLQLDSSLHEIPLTRELSILLTHYILVSACPRGSSHAISNKHVQLVTQCQYVTRILPNSVNNEISTNRRAGACNTNGKIA